MGGGVDKSWYDAIAQSDVEATYEFEMAEARKKARTPPTDVFGGM